MDELMTVVDVARVLSVKPSWVYTHAESGKLPCFHIGKYVRFKRSEIEAWLHARHATVELKKVTA